MSIRETRTGRRAYYYNSPALEINCQCSGFTRAGARRRLLKAHPELRGYKLSFARG